MREWLPISTSPKGRLALAAVREFGSRPFDEVTVGELAAAADVTTGAIYHHFGSKLGLYHFVRADVDRRLFDRIEGAAAAGGLAAALLVGFDYAVQQNMTHLLAEPPRGGVDELPEVLGVLTPSPVAALAVAAAWRACVKSVSDGGAIEAARTAIEWISRAP